MLSFIEFIESKEQSKNKISNERLGTTVTIDHRKRTARKQSVNEDGDDYLGHLASSNSHIAKDHEGVDTELSKHYQFGKEHEKAIRNYAGARLKPRNGGYLNDYLRNRHERADDSQHSAPVQKRLDGLDSALQHHKTPTHLTLFSGVRFNPGKEAAKNKHGRVFSPGYVSTTVNPRHTLNFTDSFNENNTQVHHVLRIHVPKNHPGAYVGTHTSDGTNEHEFLLPRRSSFKIHPNPEVVHMRATRFASGRVWPSKAHIWDAHPVNPEED